MPKFHGIPAHNNETNAMNYSAKTPRLHRATRSLRSLATAAAICAALLPALAQAPGDLRVALVIGNGAYTSVAALANPTNDAKAMGDTLRGLGFTVVEVRDASKAQMTQAIAQVKSTLQGKQAIGMLYYAGHGLQVDWRNYMVPVDAKMSKASEVPEQTVELAQVIDAFKAAGNRMNIVVLDACRDNPFVGTATGKGLAQLDAPTGTFLAYATAPGNVADDGDSKSTNGLYTQFLLQELKKPTAKIEDVFKRVRLNVRQQSQGRQVPWESTSLEEDFFFNAGLKPTAKLGDSDKEKAFNAEKADWDKIKDSKNASDFYAFLQQYPNGNINGLAQSRLEGLQKALVTAAVDQNGNRTVDAFNVHKNGDRYELQLTDGLTGVVLGKGLVTVKVGAEEVTGDSTNSTYFPASTLTREGFIKKDAVGTYDPPFTLIPNGEFKLGGRASMRTTITHNNGFKQWMDVSSRFTARETIDTPFGKVNTLRLELEQSYQNGNRAKMTLWYDPEWGYSVKWRREARGRTGAPDILVRETLSRQRGA
jgi:Caspase domain